MVKQSLLIFSALTIGVFFIVNCSTSKDEIAKNDQVFQLHMLPEEVSNIEELFFKLARVIDFNDRKRRNLIKRLKKRKHWEPIIISDNLSWREFARLNLFCMKLKVLSQLFLLLENIWKMGRLPIFLGMFQRQVLMI